MPHTSKISCSSISRPSSPTILPSQAFSPSPSSSSSNSSPLWSPGSLASSICPLYLSSNACSFDHHKSAASLVEHLTLVHKAKHFDIVLNEKGLADIQFETSIPLTETSIRKTGVVLSLPSKDILCWTIETKIRADGELQASAAIQMIQTSFDVAKSPNNAGDRNNGDHSCNNNHDADEGSNNSSNLSKHSSSSSRKDYSDLYFPATSSRSATSSQSSSSSSSSSSQKEEDEETPRILYNATITAANSSDLRWRGVLSSCPFSRPHDVLISHKGALVVGYPTDKEAFVQTSRVNSHGIVENYLRFPLKLNLERVFSDYDEE